MYFKGKAKSGDKITKWETFGEKRGIGEVIRNHSSVTMDKIIWLLDLLL